MRRYSKGVKGATEAALEAQVAFFLYEGIPLRLVNSPYLQSWLELLVAGSGEVARRKRFEVLVHDSVERVRSRVLAILRACKGVTVGLDGWTNVRQEKVINVVVVARGVAYYWDSLVLAKTASADDQHPQVKDALARLMGKGVRVTAVVTDNEAVNGALHNLLRKDFPWLLHIPCAAHTIQLCVRKALLLPHIAPVVDALLAMLLAFKHNKALRVKVKQVQLTLRQGKPPLQLVTVVPTRWNSILFAAERILTLQNCIRPYIGDILAQLAKERKPEYAAFTYCDSSFWHPLVTLVDFLAPYRWATNVVQSDWACLSDVHHQFATLMVRADDLTDTHPFGSVRTDLKMIIQHQWNKHVHLDAVILCALLNFDPAYLFFPEDQRSHANDWFLEWCPVFIKQWCLSDAEDPDIIKGHLCRQFSELNTRTGRFASLDERRAVLVKASIADGRGSKCDARDVWGLYVDTARELTACALSLLDITASEAAVERSFSRQGFIHSKRRNRLLSHSIHMEMAFSFNMRALNSTTESRAVRDQEEMPDEDVAAEEEGRGTVMLSTRYLPDEAMAPAEEVSQDGEAKVVDSAEVDSEVRQPEDSDEPTEEELEQKYDAAPTEEERITAFIEQWLINTPYTQGFRWTGWRQQTLGAAIIEAGLAHTVDYMIKRIKEHHHSAAAPVSL
jgi:hypothetical protein